MAAMVIAVSLVSFSTYELIRHQVSSHFEDALESQYAKQFELFQTRREERLKAVSNEIITNTSNPRLMAALYEDDFSRFYYDLGQELKPFYQNLDNQSSDADMWPFFRFIRSDGMYLSPPSANEVEINQAVDTLPGIMSPIPEDSLREMLLGLQSDPYGELRTRSGYLVSDDHKPGCKPVLLEAFVCPVLDAFGVFLGDLIVVIPWRGNRMTQVNTLTAIITQGHVFHPQTEQAKAEDWDTLVSALDAQVDLDARSNVILDDEPYIVFKRPLVFDPSFPDAEQVTLFSLAEQYILQQNIANVLALIVAGGLGFSLLLSVVVAQGLNAPIARLKDGVLKIGRGDFNARVENSSQDEIGELTDAFNQMAEDLSLKERYKNVLSQVTDSRVADRLLRGEVELGGESLDVVVFFCDIRGFTVFSSGMDPHLLISILNEHMSAMTEIAHEYGGVVDKFVGDEIMVLFGAPVHAADDMKNAFTCAQKMIERRRLMNDGSEHPIEIGIGMAYGQVVAGCMGSNDRLNYTVLGEKVNLASRLCGSAQAMEIVFDQNIYDHLGASIGPIENRRKSLKGFSGLTSFYVVRSSKPV